MKLSTLWFSLSLFWMNVAGAAVPVPLTGKLLPVFPGTAGAVCALDGNIAVVGSGQTGYGTNCTNSGVQLFDKALGAGWPLRKTITPPATLPDTAEFGKSMVVQGDTLVINSAAHLFIHRRDEGGSNQWGLVRAITRSGVGIGLDLDGDALAVQSVSSIATVKIYRRNLGGADAWGLERTVPDPRAGEGVFLPLLTEAEYFGGVIALSGDIFAVGNEVAFQRVVDLFRRNEGGTSAWGLYRTFDHTKVTGAGDTELGSAFDWSAGQLCVNSLRLTGGVWRPWIHLVTPPAAADGIWPESFATSLSGGAGVPMSFGRNLKIGEGWIAATILVPNDFDTDFVDRNMVIYRKTGGVWNSEREIGGGATGEGLGFDRLVSLGEYPDTLVERWRYLQRVTVPELRWGCNGATSLSGQLELQRPLTQPAGFAEVRERGASSLWPLTATLVQSSASGANFGRAIAMSGNTMVIGDPLDNEEQPESGAVTVWERRSGLTLDWHPIWRLKSDVPLTGASFGRAVATDGNLLMVGAPGENGGRGVVYVFERETILGSLVIRWGLRAKIRRDADPVNTALGFSLAMSGGQIAIGAPGYPVTPGSGAPGSGRVFLYRPTVAGIYTGWSAGDVLSAGDGVSNSRFGESVGYDGDIIAAGAWLQTGGGAVYLFRATGSSPVTWPQIKKLTPSNTTRGLFGGTLSLSGTTLAVGTFPPVIFPNSGGVFVFERNQGGTGQWGETRALLPIVDQSGWGGSVSVSGDTLVIGSSVQNTSASRTGAAFVHRRTEGGPQAWGLVRQLEAADRMADDTAGTAVAVEGSAIAIAATGSDTAGPDAGAVYTYRLGSYELWAGTQPFAAGEDTVNADPDHDGQSNLEEFMLASNPLNPSSLGKLEFRLTPASGETYLEGIWTKPAYSTEGASAGIRGGSAVGRFTDTPPVISDTSLRTIVRATNPVRVRPRYFMRMEFRYP